MNDMMKIRYPREYDTLNDDQRDAFDRMIQGDQNFFLTGNAGTGKSYLANVFAKACRMNGRNVAKCAPTGIAAVAIDGVTIHSMFRLGGSVAAPGEISHSQMDNLYKHILPIDVLFLDEVSMARVDHLDSVLRQIYKASQLRRQQGRKGIQVILCGDFGQLPPVVTKDDRKLFYQLYDYPIESGYCFRGEGWKFMKFHPVMLKQVMRQGDAEFCAALDKIRLGDDSGLDYIMAHARKTPTENAIWLCGNNNTVTERNKACLAKLPYPVHTSKAKIVGQASIKDTNLESYLEFKKGARVIMLVNENKFHTYCNGTMGTIEDIRGEEVDIRLDNGCFATITPLTTDFKTYEVVDGILTETVIGSITQYPFKLGYALTIHKSQGQTFDSINLMPEIFCDGQLYVALSRCRTVEGIYIQGDTINKEDVRTHEHVKGFFKKIADAAADAVC